MHLALKYLVSRRTRLCVFTYWLYCDYCWEEMSLGVSPIQDLAVDLAEYWLVAKTMAHLV